MNDLENFYACHRGGSGAVIMVTAVHDRSKMERYGIFGSMETAQEWRRSLGDEFTCVFSPYIVDDPDWGNERPD
jgi:hypothetical protein